MYKKFTKKTFNNSSATFNKSEDMNKSVGPLNPEVFAVVTHLPVVWFILGTIGFIGNTITLLKYKFYSQTYFIYLFCSSIVDIITLLINLFLVYFAFVFDVDELWFSFSIKIISLLLVFLFLPHLSINFLLTAYIVLFASTCNRRSPLQRLNKFKTIPWMISFVIICSCLTLSYAPIIFFYGSRDEKDAEKQAQIFSILYILTNGFVPSVLMLVFILLTYRNRRHNRQRAVSVSLVCEIE